MAVNDVIKPKTQRGKRIMEAKAPKLIENDKRTLIFRGGHTSHTVIEFLNAMCVLKKPLINKLKWKNPILPFDDVSFIEKMCHKYDCSLFVIGLHSKKRPDNIIFGRLHDGEVLDMFELGIKRFDGFTQSKISSGVSGAKPMIIFSSQLFDEDRKFVTLRSILLDIFRGPSVAKIRTVGVEHQIHFALTSEDSLAMRVRSMAFRHASAGTITDATTTPDQTTLLKTPWGTSVQIDITDSGPSVDFQLRRIKLPSEDKWKRSHRIPAETMVAKHTQKNRHIDVFGSRVGRVHVGKVSSAFENLRPGSSLRTSLTGHRKRGFERKKPTSDKSVSTPTTNSAKRRKI